eukprot:TRINITY_DN2067_c0_g5_i1.p1 TRINITY_DN2067_c0_g5~~TRINITY_DN2067_c0_g5_i1.p1  ORF type:complete len:184 (-),score=16.46 TRINITY_DN2067_c0_g5_i1:134-685(-)
MSAISKKGTPKNRVAPIVITGNTQSIAGQEFQFIETSPMTQSPQELKSFDIRITPTGSQTTKNQLKPPEADNLSFASAGNIAIKRGKTLSKFQNPAASNSMDLIVEKANMKSPRRSILKLRNKKGMNSEEQAFRRDVNGTPITKGSKRHRITFMEKPIITPIESWKQYNRTEEVDSHSCCFLF